MTYSVERSTPDGLAKAHYAFWLDNMELRFNSHTLFTRPSRRHGWKISKQWHRIHGHRNTMPRTEPPQDVKDEVLQQARSAITFA